MDPNANHSPGRFITSMTFLKGHINAEIRRVEREYLESYIELTKAAVILIPLGKFDIIRATHIIHCTLGRLKKK